GERRRAGHRLRLGLEPRQGVLGLGAQPFFAFQIAARLLGPGRQFALALGAALGLALEVVLFDLERLRTAPFAGSWLRTAGRWAAVSASARSALASCSVASAIFSRAAARLASSALTWVAASRQVRCNSRASDLRISADRSL